MAKIMGNERAVAALAEEADAQSAIPAHHAPDLKQKG
jgi:hypothetical protein